MKNEKMNPDKGKNYFIWIDIAKGIGIIFVVFGHLQSRIFLFKWIYSFHMALFFFLSGFLFKTYSSTDLFLKRKVKSLIIPYLLGGELVDAVYNGFYLLSGDLGLQEYFSKMYDMQGALLKGSFEELVNYNSPLWFIPCLFTTEVLFYIIVKLAKEKKYIWWSCFYIATLANLGLFPFVGFWYFTEALSWLFWVCLGYCLKERVLAFSESEKKLKGIVIIGVPVSLGCAQLYEEINKSCCPNSFIGIAVVLSVSMLIMHCNLSKNILEHVGRSSKWILIIHLYFIKVLSNYSLDTYQMISRNPVFSFAVSIVIIGCIMAILWLLRKIRSAVFAHCNRL